MNDGLEATPERPVPDPATRVAIWAVRLLLTAEAATMVVVLGWLVVDLLSLRPSSYATAIALIVLVAIGTAWVIASAVGAFRLASWSRGVAIVWQVLQLSVAIGAFQGLFARPDVGWLLLVPAVVVTVLLLWTPVRLAFTRADAAPTP